MYKHYVLVGLRNLIRHKVFAAINVFGLALGMTCCIFIFLWVSDEKSIDNFHSNGERLYTLYQTTHTNESVYGSYATLLEYGNNQGASLLLGDIEQATPEIQYNAFYTTSYELPWGHPETFQVGDKLHKLEGARASENFFSMFSYPVIAGNGATALKEINNLAISRKMAELFFNSPQNALGKSIRFENKLEFMVTAVFENVPSSSSLKFDYLISWETHMKGGLNWASNNIHQFIQLKEGTDHEDVETSINEFIIPRLAKNTEYKTTIGLQRFGDQYLNGNFVNGKPHGGRIEYVNIFSGIAIFILLVACINFMNLSTARSVRRAKEVGVRKVIGSSRTSLIFQFFGESLLLSFIAILVSITMVQILMPTFNSLTGKQMTTPLADVSFIITLLGLILFTGIIAGSYPAFFLSSLKPVRILKGVLRFSSSTVWIRKGLVVFQFTLSITLFVVTVVVSKQTQYVQNTHLGYDRENLVYIRIEGELNPNYATFKNLALKMPGIAMVDRSSEAPHAMGFVVYDAIQWEGKDVSVGFKPTSVGFDFLKLMKLQISEGRDFSTAHSTDTAAFMVNEEAIKQMGLKDPIGKSISAWNKRGTIIAVLKNHHINSLHEPIMPLIIDVKENLDFGVIIVRTEPGKTKEALASLEKVCKDINPNYPFDYQLVDKEYERLYRNEQLITKLSNVFAVFAILISCLGLLGLSIFSAEQRIKEIGIRKVMGASVFGIVTLLAKDFLMLVCISFLIAVPVAGYFTYQWLQGFAFKIELSWWIFGIAGAGALVIAALTVSIQSIQSAMANPVKSLRSE